MRRDGFGYLATRYQGEDGSLLSAPIPVDLARSKLFLNVDGLGASAYLKLELLDKLGRQLGDQTVEAHASGVHVPVRWPAISAVP